MSPAAVVRLLIAVAIIGVSTFLVVTKDPRLGLDLSGGTQIVVETQSTERTEATSAATDRVRDVLDRRVNALGIAESSLSRSGERRIIVELPGVQDPREAAETLGRTAQLTFHPVLAVATEGQQPKENEKVLPDEDGSPIVIGTEALAGEDVSKARGVSDETGNWTVDVSFRGGGDKWQRLTGEAACNPPGDPKRRVAIVLDDEVISSPQVNEGVGCNVGIAGGKTSITGGFTAKSAKDLGALIEGGSLPLPVEIIEQRTVGATLGDEAIDASFKAGIIGIALTGLFIVFVYRLMGLLATIALASYALISYAALLGLGATLTLPGLAGFVLAIGMAIDANVLVFERAREEYAERKSSGLRTALQIGFNKAWSAIIDSNVTTLLAAGLLFFLASGPVRGFGVTLSLGVLASMISALIIARALTEWMASTSFVSERPRITGISDIGRVRKWLEDRAPRLVQRATLWVGVSVAVVLVAVAGMFVRGLDLGVEFTGGRVVEYSSATQMNVDEARQAVADAGHPRAIVQESDGEDITVRTGKISNDEQVEIQEALGGLGAGEITKERDELIGPSLGSELKRNALIALGVALLAQMLYLAVRFRWTFSVAAVLAMVHDVALVVGVFAWLNKPIDGVFLAAALSIIGLSVNDTVVVFDRIREVWREPKGRSFADVSNLACLQTIPRTVNTGLGSMFILAALMILGGDSLKDFAIALLIGLVAGTYSSVFTATPLAIMMHTWSKEATPSGQAKAEQRRKKVDPYGGGQKDDSGAVI
ncbi:MAG: protein translocase subunit SecD [Propionibacteriales bacterium]|nr:protein translocase subunit SecD [Propionibacteriales bacterium]